MSQPYVGEIRIFGGSFAPSGWLPCQGQELNVADYDTLFQIIGTTYGGDGSTTFALPDLQGRVPVHRSNQFPMGSKGGAETVTLTQAQMPRHTHPMLASAQGGTLVDPGSNVLAASQPGKPELYTATEPTVAMGTGTVAPVGGSQYHDNAQPFICIGYIIAVYGVFPTPS